MTPNFLVVGAPKSGTTSLYYYLKQHPDVYLPAQKELHYFSYEQLKENANGPGDRQVLNALCANRDEYVKHYTAVRGEKLVGDISPSYLYYGVQERIRQELGLIKIVVMLRNPVEKAYSQYMHMVREQREALPFYEAILAEADRKNEGWSDIWRYAESSLYADKLAAFIDCFGRDYIHIILFDDFVTDPQKEVKSLFGFLGVNVAVDVDTNEKYNRTGNVRSKWMARFLANPGILKSIVKRITPDAWRIALRMKIMDANTTDKPAMDVEAAAYLGEYFLEDIVKLEKILGKKLNWKYVESI